jgi:hypothetical protein
MFNPKETKEIANLSGLGEKAVQRLLSSIKIESFEIGVRLARPEVLSKVPRSKLLPLLGEVLKGYRTSCPLVTAWVGRGDFDPKKIPEQVTRVLILHASRTAGRLRAKGLRMVGD